eukprot:611111-Pyramimonas_sp.AAC.1
MSKLPKVTLAPFSLPKATFAPEAKSKAKSKPIKDPTAVEPKHATFEEASAAAMACTKCLPCKDGPKGCRDCMGEWFEVVRKSGFLARSAKDLSGAGKL